MFVAEVIHLIYNNSATEDESAAHFVLYVAILLFCMLLSFVLHVAVSQQQTLQQQTQRLTLANHSRHLVQLQALPPLYRYFLIMVLPRRHNQQLPSGTSIHPHSTRLC